MPTSLLEQLIAVGVGVTQARAFEGPLKAAMALHGIVTPAQQAGFLAQGIFESDSFTDLEENLWYTTPSRILKIFPGDVETLEEAATLVRNPKALANRVYGGENGNGDEASGDGWKYRGRGIFQVTFKNNYARTSAGCGHGTQFVTNPEMLIEPQYACFSAAYYWWDNECNILMESNLFDQTTRQINGPAMLHKVERRSLYNRILEVMKNG